MAAVAKEFSEFSLTLNYKEDDKITRQEILELALKYGVRPYDIGGEHHLVFTHPNEKILRNFQEDLMSQDIDCEYLFKSPKPLK